MPGLTFASFGHAFFFAKCDLNQIKCIVCSTVLQFVSDHFKFSKDIFYHSRWSQLQKFATFSLFFVAAVVIM